jgi:predicted nucleotidyltransferase component of viral defense system
MNLHDNKEMFAEYLVSTADFLNLNDTGIVEKDYFVVYFLQKITEKQTDIVFKGGTSLSKCYKLINRFSEDIDLNVNTESAKLTEGQRKRLKKDIVSIIEESGFSLENPDQIRSRRDFNRYVVDYKSTDSYGYLKQFLIVETSVFIKSFPTEYREAASFIYDFMYANNLKDEIDKYGLEPFNVKVQLPIRTFVDKTFALADYYLSDNVNDHSRHIYDLYKLYPKLTFDKNFIVLLTEVREVRKHHAACVSAKDGVDLPNLLQKIISEKTFESDYNNITETLLFEVVPYSEAITVLHKIIDDGFFAQ